MCGIAGILDLNQGINKNILEKMTQIINYRGPDDEGYLLVGRDKSIHASGKDSCEEVKDNHSFTPIGAIDEQDCFLGFGHRRLSILDISSMGHQPMTNKDESLYITFNGEIYNYIELRDELKGKGYCFKTTSDTEVILHAYVEWGTECVQRFNGMWSFAIWDEKKNRIFCSRDRLGVKPFYYYYKKNKFVFGSEIKQIIQDNAIERHMDEETLAINLIYGISDYNNKTLIKNIVALRPGHNLVIELDEEKNNIIKFREYPYWDIKETKTKINEEDSCQMIGNEIERSIKYRMRSDVPVGALLSGGLDSSSIVTLICEQLKLENVAASEFQTFTACYDNSPQHDERNFAHHINEFNGCAENFVFPSGENVEEKFENIVWHMEAVSTFSLLGYFGVLESVHDKNIRVIINGQNGDETLFGYERYYAFYFWDLIKKGQFKKLKKEYRLAVKNSKLSARELLEYFFYFCFPIVRNTKRKYEGRKFLSRNITKQFNYKLIKPLVFPKNLKELQFNELQSTQLPHILRMDDRGYMAYSIESRVPFVDYQYIEKALAVPPEKKIKNGFTKSILREYMVGKMPDKVVWRTDKKGFSSPVERWAENYSKEYMEDLFSHARSRKYFKIEYLRDVFKTNPACPVLAKFLSVELFMRQFDIK